MTFWPFFVNSIIQYSIQNHVFNVVVETVNCFVMIFAVNQSCKVLINKIYNIAQVSIKDSFKNQLSIDSY